MDAALRQLPAVPSVEEELRARVAQQTAIAALGRRALAAATLDAVLDDAVKVVAATLGVEFSAVLELRPDCSLLLRAGAGWPRGMIGHTRLSNTPRTHSGYTLRQGQGQPVVVDDVRVETRFEFSPAIREHGIESGIAVAIGPAERPYGVLAAHGRAPRSFSQDNAAFLQAVANTLAAAVDGFAAEAQVREAEERFRTLVERLPMITWSIEFGDPLGYYVSPQVEKILGFSRDEWSYDAYVSRIHPDDRERVLATAPPYRMLEYRLLDKDDHVVWVHDEAELSTDVDGWIRGFQGFNVDVTHRKEQEELLRASEERFRALFDTALDAIVLADDGARCIDANPAACELFGVDCMVGLALPDLLAPSHRSRTLPVWDEFLARGEHRGELELELASGARRQLELSAKAHFLPGMHLGVFRDVAERKGLEAQLLQAQKMEAVGRLAGGVAHDFNNLLLVIRGYGDLLLQRLEGTPEAADLREITAAAERAASLTGQLLAFSRRQVVNPRTLALHEVVRQTMGMLRKVLGEQVELTTVFGDEGSFVRADRVQLDQVLLNLAVNARDAMPDGGSFRIETSTVTLPPTAAAGRGLPPGGYVVLAATDTGHGMDPATLDHIFEPFFTTKAPELGTGLGLSTVYGIVTQSGGTVFASSTPGVGSTLTLYLPREAGAAPSEDEVGDGEPAVAGAESILLVEDDERVRMLVSQMLASFGYSVTAVGDPADAVGLAGRLEPLDLLLTDVVMPGLNGPQVAARSQELRPGLPVLFMSGHADRQVIEEQVLARGESFLPKPFSRDELGRKLRDVLGR